MTETELKIEGMNCHHCVMSVKRELGRLQGVTVKDVRIGSAVVAYDERTVTPSQLAAAVEEAGYSVVQ